MNGPKNISGTFIVSYDLASNEDTTIAWVAKVDGDKYDFVGSYTGDEAEWMYNRLNNPVKEGLHNDDGNSKI